MAAEQTRPAVRTQTFVDTHAMALAAAPPGLIVVTAFYDRGRVTLYIRRPVAVAAVRRRSHHRRGYFQHPDPHLFPPTDAGVAKEGWERQQDEVDYELVECYDGWSPELATLEVSCNEAAKFVHYRPGHRVGFRRLLKMARELRRMCRRMHAPKPPAT